MALRRRAGQDVESVLPDQPGLRKLRFSGCCLPRDFVQQRLRRRCLPRGLHLVEQRPVAFVQSVALPRERLRRRVGERVELLLQPLTLISECGLGLREGLCCNCCILRGINLPQQWL